MEKVVDKKILELTEGLENILTELIRVEKENGAKGLEEYKIAKAPLVDEVREEYTKHVKNSYYLEKALKNIKKATKQINKTILK
jgi:hypothetical protein